MTQTSTISKIEPQASTEVAVSSESAAILSIIERAARDQSVDIDKMERLLQMQERLVAQRAKAAFTAALVAVKPRLPVVDRRGRIEVRDKNDREKVIQSTPFALWEDIDERITPVLADHGLVLSFRSGVAHDGKITVTGVLSHSEGHSEETTITLPHDSSGSKNAVQAVGSSTSYGKRYTATLLLNIRTRGEDDDGKAGGIGELISDDQLRTLRDLIDDAGGNVRAVCEFYKIDALAEMPAATFERACKALRNKAAQRQKAEG
jgi:hypothetical protein